MSSEDARKKMSMADRKPTVFDGGYLAPAIKRLLEATK
jgi:hypothetical protein